MEAEKPEYAKTNAEFKHFASRHDTRQIYYVPAKLNYFETTFHKHQLRVGECKLAMRVGQLLF